MIKKLSFLSIILIGMFALSACTSSYTITFESNGGSIVESQEVEDNDKANKPLDPTREGYTFNGWFINGYEPWVFGGYDVTEDITLTASWTANQYTVTYDAGEGFVSSNSEVYTYDTWVTLPTPVLADNYFMGWYDGTEHVESGTWSVDEDITLTAYWIQENYNVYYDYGYDDLENTEVASYGQNYTPINPTREGYNFNGWMDENDDIYRGGVWELEDDLYLDASWTANTYTITLDVNGGTLEGSTSYEVTYDAPFSLPIPTSSSDSFNGWYVNGTKFTDKFGVGIEHWTQTMDLTLEAIYYIAIATSEDLLGMSNDLGATYYLQNDIDLTGIEWTPIGNNITPFAGTFDGNGYTLSNVTITNTQDYVGLFGYNSGTIRNLSIDHVSINVTGNISSSIYGGSFVGYNTGILENLHVLDGSIYIKTRGGNNGYVGGIVGYNSKTITLDNLSNQANVVGDLTKGTGGLVGSGDNSTIADSTNSGAVSGTSSGVGGLVGSGYNSTITISNSTNSGAVSGTSNGVGGLVGSGYNSTITISNSTNSGAVSGTNHSVGGLVGYGDYRITISNSTNSGAVSGKLNVGGLVGYGYDYSTITITDSINNGTVSGTSEVGGLVGDVSWFSTITITNSTNSGAVSGTSEVGGLVGYGYKSTLTINNSTNSGSVSGTEHVGGLVGEGKDYSTIIAINNSTNSGTVSGTNYVGGLVGYGYYTTNSGVVSGTSISNSTNSGAVSGTSEVGGLVGYGYYLTIMNSTNSGTVSGTSEVGGLVGYGRSIISTNSSNSGTVSGTSEVGGLVGDGYTIYVYYSINFGDVTATNSTIDVGGISGYIPSASDYEDAYYTSVIKSNNVVVTGNAFGTKITDLTTLNSAFFTDTMGWDPSVWDLTNIDVVNGLYPILIIDTQE